MSLLNYIEKSESYSFSNDDIQKICNGKVNIVMYHDLANYSDLMRLFKNCYPCVLLYETTQYYQGHWICLLYHPKENLVELFDSYGFAPDYDLKYCKFKTPYLSALIQNTKVKYNINFSYNTTCLQAEKNGVNTCGRWASIRAVFQQYNNDQFNNLFTPKLSLNNPDEVISLMTLLINLQH